MIASFAEAPNMDRQILLQQLAQAERRVAEGRAFIAQQQRLSGGRAGWPGYSRNYPRAGKISDPPAIPRARAREDSRRDFRDDSQHTPKPTMKAVTFAAFALALISASPGDAKDIIDASTPSPFVAPVAQPDRPHLKRGDSGGDVPILQKALNSHGERLTVDGFFGPHTERAVKDFQVQSGLETTW